MVKDIHHKKKQLIMPAVKIINIKLLIGMICILSYPVLMFSQTNYLIIFARKELENAIK